MLGDFSILPCDLVEDTSPKYEPAGFYQNGGKKKLFAANPKRICLEVRTDIINEMMVMLFQTRDLFSAEHPCWNSLEGM